MNVQPNAHGSQLGMQINETGLSNGAVTGKGGSSRQVHSSDPWTVFLQKSSGFSRQTVSDDRFLNARQVAGFKLRAPLVTSFQRLNYLKDALDIVKERKTTDLLDYIKNAERECYDKNSPFDAIYSELNVVYEPSPVRIFSSLWNEQSENKRPLLQTMVNLCSKYKKETIGAMVQKLTNESGKNRLTNEEKAWLNYYNFYAPSDESADELIDAPVAGGFGSRWGGTLTYGLGMLVILSRVGHSAGDATAGGAIARVTNGGINSTNGSAILGATTLPSTITSQEGRDDSVEESAVCSTDKSVYAPFMCNDSSPECPACTMGKDEYTVGEMVVVKCSTKKTDPQPSIKFVCWGPRAHVIQETPDGSSIFTSFSFRAVPSLNGQEYRCRQTVQGSNPKICVAITKIVGAMPATPICTTNKAEYTVGEEVEVKCSTQNTVPKPSLKFLRRATPDVIQETRDGKEIFTSFRFNAVRDLNGEEYRCRQTVAGITRECAVNVKIGSEDRGWLGGPAALLSGLMGAGGILVGAGIATCCCLYKRLSGNPVRYALLSTDTELIRISSRS